MFKFKLYDCASGPATPDRCDSQWDDYRKRYHSWQGAKPRMVMEWGPDMWPLNHHDSMGVSQKLGLCHSDVVS